MTSFSLLHFPLHSPRIEAPTMPSIQENPAILAHIKKASSDDIEFSAVPSAIQPLFVCTHIRACTERKIAAQRLGDYEGMVEADYKLRQVPFTCVASLSATIASLKSISSTMDTPFVKTALRVSIIFGFICAVFEIIYESFWIYRLQRFLNKPAVQLLQLMQKDLTLQQTQKIFAQYRGYLLKHLPEEQLTYATYCQNPLRLYGVSEESLACTAREAITSVALRCLKNKYFNEDDVLGRVKLERRIRPWCYAEIQKELNSTIELLDSFHPTEVREGKRKADVICKLIETQIHKKRLLHIMGLIGGALSIALLIVSTLTLPWTTPLILLVAFYGLSTIQYIAYAGLLDNPGWKFTASSCIPKGIKNTAAKIARTFTRIYEVCTNSIRRCIKKCHPPKITVLLPALQKSSPSVGQPLCATQHLQLASASVRA